MPQLTTPPNKRLRFATYGVRKCLRSEKYVRARIWV